MRNKLAGTRNLKPGTYSKGFTLIELVVVMAIIAVLAVLIIGAIVVARRTATETTNRSNTSALQVSLEAYYSRNKVYCGAPGGVACGPQSYTALRDDLVAEGITVNLNTTESATGGGTVTALSATGATLVPYTAGAGSTTQMAGSTVTVP